MREGPYIQDRRPWSEQFARERIETEITNTVLARMSKEERRKLLKLAGSTNIDRMGEKSGLELAFKYLFHPQLEALAERVREYKRGEQ